MEEQATANDRRGLPKISNKKNKIRFFLFRCREIPVFRYSTKISIKFPA